MNRRIKPATCFLSFDPTPGPDITDALYYSPHPAADRTPVSVGIPSESTVRVSASRDGDRTCFPVGGNELIPQITGRSGAGPFLFFPRSRSFSLISRSAAAPDQRNPCPLSLKPSHLPRRPDNSRRSSAATEAALITSRRKDILSSTPLLSHPRQLAAGFSRERKFGQPALY